MKKLLLYTLAVSLTFLSCEQEDEKPSVNNNTSNTGSIADFAGVWQYLARYDDSGNLVVWSAAEQNCFTQTSITIDASGNTFVEYYSLDGTGTCILQSIPGQFLYVNTTTINSVGSTTTQCPLISCTISAVQLQVPVCISIDDGPGFFNGSYDLYEKQP